MGTESNNGKQEDQVLNGEQLMRLVENRLLTDRMLLSMFGDRRRNIESECGYKQTAEITAKDYQDIFDREPVAARVVNVFPMECWQLSPQLIEDEDIDNVTEFEQAWTDIGRSILSPGMEGYFKDERVNPLWSYLERADIWSGIGSYGTILLGIDDGKELEEPAQFISKSGSATRKLNFLRVLSEVECQITQFDNDRTSVRYGKPEMYNVVFGTPSFNQTKPYIGSAIGANQMATRKVHWSRIIHVVDNPYGTEVGGIPRMQQVYNRLYDLHKLYGGSAEMYWQGAFPGISFETHPSLGGDVKLDEPTRRAMKEQLVNYTQGLQRWLTMAGMSAKTLAPQVVDPTSHIEAEIQAICILLGVPKRVFMGSERGELSSNQDIRAWYGRCKHRQDSYITPFLIVQFIDRLINLGVLPVPKQGYSIQWPDLASATDLEKAQIAVQRMQALSSYMMGRLYQLVTPKDALTRIVGFDESEANQMIEDTQENMDQMQEAHLEQSTQPPEPPQGDQQGGDKKKVKNSEPAVVIENNWDVEWVEDSLVNNTIVKTTAGYMVVSESKGANGERKNLGGPYTSRQKAEKRLQQVEYFKHVGNSKGNFGHAGRPGKVEGSSKHEEAAEHEYQQTLGGEYWLQDGIVLYADGDVGDMNHEGYAIDQAQRLLADGLGVDTDGEYVDWDEVISALKEQAIEELPGKWDEEEIEDDAIDPIADLDDKELNQLGVDKELWHIAQGHGDARAYATDNWDWIRLVGNFVQMKSESQLKQLADGIADAHQDVDLENESFGIETKRAFYRDVPWSVIDGGKPADLQEYKAHGTPGWGGVQNMDVDNVWSDEARQKALETRRRNKEIKAIKDKPLGKGAMKIAEQTPIATSIKQPGQIKYGPGDELRRMAKMTYEQARQHTEIRSNTAHKQTKDINPSASIAEQMSQTNAAAFDHHIAAQSHKVASGLTHDAELVKYHQLRVGQHNKQYDQLQTKFMELRAKQLEESAPAAKAEPAPQHQEDMDVYQAHRKADHALTQALKAVKDANVGVKAPNKMVRDRYLNKGISELKQHIATLRQGSEAHQREADRLEKKVADYQKLVNNAWSDKAREAAALSRKAHAAGTKASKLPTANSMVRSMRRFTGKENKPITTQIANRGIKLHKQAVEAHQAAVKALVGVDPDSLSKRENDELVDTIQTHEYSIDHHRGEVKHYKKWLSQFGDTQS